MLTDKGRIRIVQRLMFGVNLCLLMYGFTLLVLGVWTRVDSRFEAFVSEEFRRALMAHNVAGVDVATIYIGTWLFVAVGMISIVTAFIGCCGVISFKKWCLLSFVGLLILLFGVELAFGVWSYVEQNQIENQLGAALQYMVDRYYLSPEIFRDALDDFQEGFECCADSGCGDFRDIKTEIPKTCGQNCEGCRRKVTIALQRAFTALAIVSLAVMIVELIGIVLAFFAIRGSTRYRPAVRMPKSYTEMTALEQEPPIQPPPYEDEAAGIPQKGLKFHEQSTLPYHQTQKQQEAIAYQQQQLAYQQQQQQQQQLAYRHQQQQQQLAYQQQQERQQQPQYSLHNPPPQLGYDSTLEQQQPQHSYVQPRLQYQTQAAPQFPQHTAQSYAQYETEPGRRRPAIL